MADEFPIGSGNWWESSSRNMSSMDSVSGSGSSSSMVFPADTHNQNQKQLMGLALSSQAMDWNQTLIQGGKGESSFHSVLQHEDLSSSSSFQQETAGGNEYKQMNRGFSLDDQPQYTSHISSGDRHHSNMNATNFQMDPATAYNSSPFAVLQGLLGPDASSHQQQSTTSFDNRPMMNNYSYPPPSYGAMNSGDLLPPWSKYPPGQLQLSNKTPFWNATGAATSDVRSSFFPSLQPQFPPPTLDEKPKNAPEVRDSSTVAKKSSSSTTEASTKRPRSEAPTPMPAFKVRKEKMGDRITALQQLVSPFGKTDTASVLSEAIEYIKFLHEQVSVLSTPYMKSGTSMHAQHHKNTSDKSKEQEGPKQDLRSRGLCLVPVSSTFPVTHETTVDFWNPTFGGTYR